jgi:hypothetical protein
MGIRAVLRLARGGYAGGRCTACCMTAGVQGVGSALSGPSVEVIYEELRVVGA